MLSTSLLKHGAQTWTQYSSCGLTSAAQRGRIASLDLLEMHLWMQDKVRSAFLTASPHCRPMFILESVMTPRSFSASVLTRRELPSL